VKKETVGQTTVYINKYFEKNITTGESTSSYYLGGKLIAQRKGISPNFELNYVLQDHLGSTVATAQTNGTLTSTIKYFPWGATRSTTGTLPTDKKFTGQRLDSTGLYYYNARYYDPAIGRFISPDTIVPDPANPQSLNRYAYCLNNPLKFVDPTGHEGTDPITTWLEWLWGEGSQSGGGSVGAGNTENEGNGSPSLPIQNVSIGPPTPPEPALPTQFKIEETFCSVMPTTAGTVYIVIQYGWQENSLSVDISVTTVLATSAGDASGSVSVEICIDGKYYNIDLETPSGCAIRPADSCFQQGSREFTNLSQGAQAVITIYVGITVYGDWDQPSYSWITKPIDGKWSYALSR